MLAGCAGGDDDGDDGDGDGGGSTTGGGSDTDTDGGGGDDVYGGTLRTVLRSDPIASGGIQTHTSSGSESRAMLGLYCEPLVQLGPDGGLVPLIAEDWEEDTDAGQLRWQIREGIQFHPPYDRELVAEDVVWNFRQIADPEYGSDARPRIMGGTVIEEGDDPEERIYASGEYEVTFEMYSIPAFFVERMNYGRFGIRPPEAYEEHGDDLGTAEVGEFGTGPFIFEEAQENEVYRFTRNDDYYREGEHGQLPYLDGVEMRVVPEQSSRRAALEAGDIDHAVGMSAADLEAFEQNPDIEADNQIGLRMTQCHLNNWHPDYGDEESGSEPHWPELYQGPELNQALQYAANPTAVNNAAYDGLGEIARYYVPPWHEIIDEIEEVDFGWDETRADEATELIQEAGFENGEMNILVQDREDFVDSATVLEQNWQQVGLTTLIETGPRSATWDFWRDDSWSDRSQNSDNHGCIQDFGRGGAHVHFYTIDANTHGQIRNFNYWVDDQFEEWADELPHLPVDEQNELYRTMLERLNEECPGTRLVWQPVIQAMRTYVNNVPQQLREDYLLGEAWLDADAPTR